MGVGGGIFLVPLLLVFSNYAIEQIVGLVAFCLFCSSSIASFMNYRNHNVDYRFALIFEAPSVVGAFLGVLVLSLVDQDIVKIIFVIYLSYVVIGLGKNHKTFFNYKKLGLIGPQIKTHSNERFGLALITCFGLFAGAVAGLLGVGGGIIKTPFMTKALGFSLKNAAATSVFMIAITSLAAVLAHILNGNFVIGENFGVIIGFCLGGLLGPRLREAIDPVHNLKLLRVMIVFAIIIIVHEVVSA